MVSEVGDEAEVAQEEEEEVAEEGDSLLQGPLTRLKIREYGY